MSLKEIAKKKAIRNWFNEDGMKHQSMGFSQLPIRRSSDGYAGHVFTINKRFGDQFMVVLSISVSGPIFPAEFLRELN
jgi:hypothetical protein